MNNMTENDIVPANQNSTQALSCIGHASLSLSLASAGRDARLAAADVCRSARAREGRRTRRSGQAIARVRRAASRKSPSFAWCYGMALCVNLEVQDAMEELGEAVSLAPNSFIAHLKMGELWMRLARLREGRKITPIRPRCWPQNMAQSELARRQAATLRTMMREGVERGGYRTPWLSLGRLRRLWNRNRDEAEALATVDARLDDAAGPSACAAARHSAAGCKDRGLGL